MNKCQQSKESRSKATLLFHCSRKSDKYIFFFPASGQKPFPCQKCDAFFSTKSNCERHQLRKHGVTTCSLRRNGLIPPKEGDVGSHDSTGRASR